MKRVLFLVNSFGPKNAFILEYLQNNIGKDIEITLGLFSNITFEIDKGSVIAKHDGELLEDYDVVYFRRVTHEWIRIASCIAHFCKMKKIKFIDECYLELGPAGNKLNSLIKLAFSNVSVIPTLYFSREKVLSSHEDIIKKLGFPIFAKSLTKQRKSGIFYITYKEDFQKLLDADDGEGFLFQKEVKIKREYRLVVMGDKVVALYKEAKRVYKDNRTPEYAEEIDAEWVDVEEASFELRKESVLAAKTLGLNIAGVDGCTLKDSNEIYIFEANRGPEFTIDPLSPEVPALVNYFKELA